MDNHDYNLEEYRRRQQIRIEGSWREHNRGRSHGVIPWVIGFAVGMPVLVVAIARCVR